MKNELKFDELNKLYEESDETIKLLSGKASRRILKAKSALYEEEFEDLMVYRILDNLYKNMDTDNRTAFLNLAKHKYNASPVKGKEIPSERWLNKLLSAPCPTVKYAYDTETERKKNRAVEAINASKTRIEKIHELTKAAKYWAAQTGFFSDYVTEQSTLKAYKDAGIDEVKWITVKDEKVCEECNSRHGKVYKIDKIPDRHPRCRCILEPVIK